METEVDAAGDEEMCNWCSDGLVAVERASIQGPRIAQILDIVHETADGTVELSCTMPRLETDPKMSRYGYGSSKQGKPKLGSNLRCRKHQPVVTPEEALMEVLPNARSPQRLFRLAHKPKHVNAVP